MPEERTHQTNLDGVMILKDTSFWTDNKGLTENGDDEENKRKNEPRPIIGKAGAEALNPFFVANNAVNFGAALSAGPAMGIKRVAERENKRVIPAVKKDPWEYQKGWNAMRVCVIDRFDEDEDLGTTGTAVPAVDNTGKPINSIIMEPENWEVRHKFHHDDLDHYIAEDVTAAIRLIIDDRYSLDTWDWYEQEPDNHQITTSLTRLSDHNKGLLSHLITLREDPNNSQSTNPAVEKSEAGTKAWKREAPTTFDLVVCQKLVRPDQYEDVVGYTEPVVADGEPMGGWVYQGASSWGHTERYEPNVKLTPGLIGNWNTVVMLTEDDIYEYSENDGDGRTNLNIRDSAHFHMSSGYDGRIRFTDNAPPATTYSNWFRGEMRLDTALANSDTDRTADQMLVSGESGQWVPVVAMPFEVEEDVPLPGEDSINTGVYNINTSRLYVDNGSAANPSISFADHTDKGLYDDGTDLCFSTGGTKAGSFDTSGNLTTVGVYKAPDGSPANPSFTFTGTTDMGMYRSGGALGFSVGGSYICQMSATYSLFTSDVWITDTGAQQLKLRYNASNTCSFSVANDGGTTITATGTDPEIIFVNDVTVSATANPALNITASAANGNPSVVLANGDQSWTVQTRGATSDYFAIKDDTGGNTLPFRIQPGAPDYSVVLRTTEVVVNEGGADVNFRVKSTGHTNAFRVDAGANTVRMLDDGHFFNFAGHYINRTQAGTYSGAELALRRADAGPAAVADTDVLGYVNFQGWDGDSWVTGAQIRAVVDAAVSDEVVPSRLHIYTSDTSGNLDWAMQIDDDQYVQFAAGMIINQHGIDSDTRIASNNNANMLFVDAGNDRVGIGLNSPEATLHVQDSDFPLGIFERTTSSTDVTIGGLVLKATTSENMADDFGPELLFATEDDAASNNYIAKIGAVRNGADNSGKLVFDTYSAGSASTKMSIDSDGVVTFSGRLAIASGAVNDLALRFTSDEDTGIYRVAANIFGIAASGIAVANFGVADVIINGNQNDVNFVAKGSGDSNLLHVDAGDDKVGIGTSTVTEKLTVAGNIAVSGNVDGVDVAALNTKVAKLLQFYVQEEGSNVAISTAYVTMNGGRNGHYMSGGISNAVVDVYAAITLWNYHSIPVDG